MKLEYSDIYGRIMSKICIKYRMHFNHLEAFERGGRDYRRIVGLIKKAVLFSFNPKETIFLNKNHLRLTTFFNRQKHPKNNKNVPKYILPVDLNLGNHYTTNRNTSSEHREVKKTATSKDYNVKTNCNYILSQNIQIYIT